MNVDDYYRSIGVDTIVHTDGYTYTYPTNQPLISLDGQAITGTNGDDTFNANYWDVYPMNEWLDVDEVKCFHSGAGNDTVGGNDINNEIYGGTGNDLAYNGGVSSLRGLDPQSPANHYSRKDSGMKRVSCNGTSGGTRAVVSGEVVAGFLILIITHQNGLLHNSIS